MVLHQLNMHVISDDNLCYDTIPQTIQMAEQHVRNVIVAVINQVPTARLPKETDKNYTNPG
jgi:hypothetical protein